MLLINAPTWLYYSLFEKYKCIKATATFLQRVVLTLVGWWFLGGLFRRAFFAVVFYKGVKDKVQQYYLGRRRTKHYYVERYNRTNYSLKVAIIT